MLRTNCVDDNYKMLVTNFSHQLSWSNFHYLFTCASGSNIHKMSSMSKFSHQHLKIVTNFKTRISWWHQHNCHCKTVTAFTPNNLSTFKVLSKNIRCSRTGSATVMLVTVWSRSLKVGYNFKMLVTVLVILVTNILYLSTLATWTNIKKMSPRS